MQAKTQQVHELFQQFLEVCNQAMEAHKEEFPYKYIWEAAEDFQDEDGMHVTIYDDEPKGDYQLRMHDKHIEVMDDSQQSDTSGWRLNISYLKQVVENPEAYISEPAKLDWQWLKNRVGMD